jgi:alkaline phosphatase D
MRILIWLFCLILFSVSCDEKPSEPLPYNAQGDLAGEVTNHSAIIKTRLTRNAHRNPTTTYYTKNSGRVYVSYSEDMSENVPGTTGWARIWYGSDSSMQYVKVTPWKEAEQEHDYYLQFKLEDLPSSSVIWYRSEMALDTSGSTRLNRLQSFRTAPNPEEYVRLNFIVITCWAARSRDIYRDGKPWGFQQILSMQELDPDFCIHTGDMVYYDTDSPCATELSMMRYHWRRIFSIPCVSEFFRQRGIYAMKDDHDYRWDDAWPQQEVPHYIGNEAYNNTDEMGRQVFLDAVPMGEKTYRTVRWGKAVQLFMVEGRDYRSPNTMPDGPDKTIWGAEQKAWLKRELLNSDAVFKILVSPTPMVGPDRATKRDNHADEQGFRFEGREFLKWIVESGIENFYIVNGDRHWQYHSIDDTGINEFSCGAISDVHAAVNQPYWDPERQPYFRDGKGCFLQVVALGDEKYPELRMIHRDVDGTPVNVKRFEPNGLIRW